LPAAQSELFRDFNGDLEENGVIPSRTTCLQRHVLGHAHRNKTRIRSRRELNADQKWKTATAATLEIQIAQLFTASSGIGKYATSELMRLVMIRPRPKPRGVYKRKRSRLVQQTTKFPLPMARRISLMLCR
jgi:hypothetical protein